jgi:competence protein ComEA
MKEFLYFSRRDRKGIISLAVIILSLLLLNIVFSHKNTMTASSSENAYDSLLIKVEQMKPKIKLVELNTADSAALLPIPGIGPTFASRIIKYRDKLGGFVCSKQLLEIYGITEENFPNIEKHIIINDSIFSKINVNRLEFKQILKHPYIDYEKTKKIVNARNKSKFSSTDDFVSRTGITDSLLLRYISF